MAERKVLELATPNVAHPELELDFGIAGEHPEPIWFFPPPETLIDLVEPNWFIDSKQAINQ